LGLKSIKIVLTFFFLWITTQFDLEIENVLAYMFILSLGVLHGSNDIRLMRSLNKVKNNNLKRDLLQYMGVAVITFFVFILQPIIGLWVFILISGYHFGEQYLADKISSSYGVKLILFIFYGLLIFFMLFYTHFEDVSLIIEDIAGLIIDVNYYKYAFLSTLTIVTVLMLVLFSAKLLLVNIFEELTYILLFYILFMNSTLLWSFAIYFIVWHSIPSLRDQIVKIYGGISMDSILKYIKESFLYWVFSVIGIYILSILTKDDIALFNLLFIALLAAITLPHVIIMGKMHR